MVVSEILRDKQVLVFDMDGTLYQHDGEYNTFKSSSLSKKVSANAIQYVIDKEKCSLETASQIVEEARKDDIGVSNFMAKRYKITRATFFNVVWNIEPSDIIRSYGIQVEVARKIAKQGKRLFLLTGAPRVWMENVLRFLVLEDIFERKYQGEMFATKNEVFENLANEFDPRTILSIGDQLETDLKPAMDLGMSTFHVKNPSDVKN